jgi:hypothetical protein
MSGMRFAIGAVALTLVLVGCSSGKKTAAPTTTVAATTTTTAALSQLTVDGQPPGSCAEGSGATCVLRPPFYPQITVTQVTCGPAPKGGTFVRIDLPAGGTGTPAHTVFTEPTAVIVVNGGAVLVNPSHVDTVLYDEAMTSITTAAQGGVFVLAMTNAASRGADGLTVEVGAVQINGGYQCPATAVAYPGT